MFHTSNTFVPFNYALREANAVFIGVPFASTSTSKPAIYGPVMVREALKLTEDYVGGKRIFEKIKLCDAGDVEIVPGSYELTAKRIRETIADMKAENTKAFPIFVGGEHLITLPIVETLKPKTIIHLDAHADLRREYLGNEYMHQTWGYHASKLAKIVQIGVVSWSEEEKKVAKEKGIVSLTADEFLKKTPVVKGPVHLTIDVDILEGAATGLPEGRMSMETLDKILDKIKCDSMDICEIADDTLPSATGFKAAHIIMRMLGKV
ncbi:MAG: arginase family protein [Candidatus Aenigmarchaeota archaeon]|nr:arginase family protein [Candidatus Aenigmarchaeota archaeon]